MSLIGTIPTTGENSILTTILKVMTKFQMLYSYWLDQEVAPPT